MQELDKVVQLVSSTVGPRPSSFQLGFFVTPSSASIESRASGTMAGRSSQLIESMVKENSAHPQVGPGTGLTEKWDSHLRLR